MEPALKHQFAGQQITFRFNPPHALPFDGVWEREVKSIKAFLSVVLGIQHIPEPVL